MKKLEMEWGRWSSEALKAMETHLWLLQRASKVRKRGKEEGEEAKRLLRSSAPCETHVGPDLDLNSHIPLPHGWEQFLDLQTGQVYYIDWKSCRRSYMDPRKLPSNHTNVNSKGSVLHHHQLNAKWDFQSSITDPEISEITSDGCNYASNMELKDDIEVDSQLITSPMLQEDWNLMELRGWMSFNSDNHSEVSSEVSSPNNVNNEMRSGMGSPNIVTNERSISSCEAESKAKVDMGVMACHHCLSFFMDPKRSPWCPNCGDALV